MPGPYRLSTNMSWYQTECDLGATFDKWGVRHYQIIGQKYLKRQQQTPEERTVSVIFTHPSGKEVRVTKGDLARGVDNFRALYLALEDMRMLEKRGVADVVREALAQLPPGRSDQDPLTILGVPFGASEDQIKARWRELARKHHPDVGGDADEFKRLSSAYQAALQEVG